LGRGFWSRLWLLLYIPLLFVLFVLVFVTSVYEVIPLLCVLVVYVVLGVWVSDSRVLVLVNSYLFVGVLSNFVLFC